LATAQQFKTHYVKQGETLFSIARDYQVAPAEILKYNKEVKDGTQLKINTVLVIPVPATTSQTVIPANSPEMVDPNKVLLATQEDPIGFTTHKVKRKETLYGIAQRYHITEDDIKKYNRNLYSMQLKKKMVLRIPKYRRLKPGEIVINEADFETYVVAPKETRWSIANKFGITIDSLLSLNPELSKSNDYLREGQELKMPKPLGSTIPDQETQLYVSYTVPPKMNFYRLEQEFGVKSDEIVRLNPEIAEKGGLKEGMIIRMPQKKSDPGEVNTDNFIFYEVKPKQTEFSLTRKLGISYKDLLALNPDLKEGLKAGMVLKLPKDQTGNFEVRNALVLDNISLIDSINPANVPKLMFLLPFRLDRLNFKNEEEVAKGIESRNDIKISLGLYTGALVALDSIAKLGISVDVATFDNQLDLNRTKEILSRENLAEYNAIIGPLDVGSLTEVAARAANYRVPVIAPIPATTNVSLTNVFFSYPTDFVLRKKMLKYVKDQVTDQNIIIIADKRNGAVRDTLVSAFPNAKIATVIEEEKNIGVDIEKLKALLSKDHENWVFVETDDFKLVSSITSILNSFQNTLLDPLDKNKIKVRMFTTNKNKAFDSDVVSNSHLSNLNFTYPSAYREVGNDSFVRDYEKRFGESPDKYAVRGFDITYDLLLKLAYRKDLMAVSKLIGETEYTGNKFSYEKDFASGFYNQAAYIIAFDNMQIIEVKDKL
jgi:LysM repeat protein